MLWHFNVCVADDAQISTHVWCFAHFLPLFSQTYFKYGAEAKATFLLNFSDEPCNLVLASQVISDVIG